MAEKKKATTKTKAKTKAKAKAETKAAPPPEPVSVIDSYAADILSLAMEERSSEQGKNATRFKRGALMVNLADEARAAKLPFKVILDDVNAHAMSLAENNGIIDFDPVSNQEATTTRRVVEKFGAYGEYPLVNAVNKLTGDPLVDDSGQPLVVDLQAVAVNKLYALASIDEEHLADAVSFAFRHTEKVVRKAKSVARNTERPLHEVIDALNKARVTTSHPVSGAPIEVQPEDRDALMVLADMAGEPAESEVVSIKTTRALYEGFYVPLKKLFSGVLRAFNPAPIAASSDGQVSNAFVLEQTIVQFFNIYEDEGVQRALTALVLSELITEKQADEFVNTFAFDPVTDEWARHLSEDDVAQAADALGDWEDDPEVVAEVEAEAAAQDDDDDLWDDDPDDFDDDDDDTDDLDWGDEE